MHKVSEVMSRDVRHVAPAERLRRAAQMMRELDVGALPVCDGEQLVGMVTDRDIVVRGTAAGLGPDEASVADVMSEGVHWCFADQTVDEVMRQMADRQVRRIPVISDERQRQLVGMVALGDLAMHAAEPAAEPAAAQTLREVSEPRGSRP